MTVEEFEAALAELGWKAVDFARRTGLERTSVWRWTARRGEIPRWVPEYLGAVLEIQRLHRRFVVPLPVPARGDPEA